MKRRRKPPTKTAPPSIGIEFGMADFDRLSAVALDLRDADLFLRLLRDVAMGEDWPLWQTETLLDAAHEKFGSALKLFDSAHAEWKRRLGQARGRRSKERRRSAR